MAEQEDLLLTPEDNVFINEITKRCCGSPWGTVHAEVQYTALHFQSKGKQEVLKAKDRPKLDPPPRFDKVYHDIREILRVVNGIRNFGMGEAYNKYVDQILSIMPDEEEILKDIRCSRCGKTVAGRGDGMTVVRAWVECPECIEKQPSEENIRRDERKRLLIKESVGIITKSDYYVDIIVRLANVDYQTLRGG